jgi:hypothetical protein
VKVVSIGDAECKIAFEADVSYSAWVRYDDPDSITEDDEHGYIALRKKIGMVDDLAEMTGVAKLTLKEDNSGIEEVSRLEFDFDEICITAAPPVRENRDW